MQQNEEKHGRVQLRLPERALPFEVAAECALPDYRSEISRLLWVRPTILPPERFIGGGKAEFSGKILLEILYTGPDGSLYAADHEEGYSFTLPLEGAYAAEEVEVFASPIADAVISRVTGPRRLSVRCRLHAHVHGFAPKDLSLQQRGLPQNAVPHLLCDAVDVGFAIGGGREELSLSDTIPCEENERILCARGNLLLPEVSAGTDEVRVGGEALVTLLCCAPEQTLPSVRERRIPFECRVPLEGVRPHHNVAASGVVGRIEPCVENGQISLSLHLILCAEAQHEEPITVCRDVFLPGQHAEYRFEELTAWQTGSCCSRHFSVSAERPLEELGFGEELEIIDHVCEAEITEKSTESGKTVLIGRLQCHMLCRRGGELCTMDAPLSFRLVPGYGTEGAFADCQVASCRLRAQNGVLRADAEMQLLVRDALPLPLHALCEVGFTPCEESPRAAIELYYPTPSETLWDVAKKYGVAPDALAEANGLVADALAAPDSLAGKRFVLIP
jgi:hypothetical protein